MKFTPALAAALLLALAAPVSADIVMKAEQEAPVGSAPTASTFRISPKGVRMDTTRNGATQSVIYRRDSNSFIILDVPSKKFSEMTEADMEAMGAKVAAALKQMEAQLASLPPEQQAMMRKMMQGKMPQAAEVKTDYEKVASGEKVGPWTTDKYVAMREGEKTAEIWTAPAAAVGISDDDLAALKAMSAFSAKAASHLGAGSQVLPMDDPRLGGVPVKNVTYLDGKAISQITVLSVEKQALPASTFETPEGYTKRELMPR